MKKRPVLIASTVTSAVALAVAFGLEVSAEQLAAIVAFVSTVTAFWTQSQVSPVTKS